METVEQRVKGCCSVELFLQGQPNWKNNLLGKKLLAVLQMFPVAERAELEKITIMDLVVILAEEGICI